MQIEVRPAASRFETCTDQVVSRHSFSYGPHYDPANVGFALLAAHNDDLLQPGAGFSEHAHRGVDIITWVVSGALRHIDDAGGSAIVRPGVVQRLSAGTGVRHSEFNASDGVTRYVQMWLMPDAEESPDYAVVDAPAGEGGFAVIASGSAPAPIRLRQPKATLLAAHLRPGDSTRIPPTAFLHLYVVDGAVLLGDVPLVDGDAARVTDADEVVVTADAGREVSAGCEVLAWLMDAEPWRPSPDS